MFRTVVGAFIAFVRALETARTRRGMDGAAPLGGDREAGEFDPGALSEAADDGGEWQSPLPLLDEPPASGIKFLNKREREDLALVIDCGPLARRLPMSVLRAEVFGQVQGRITQALRRKSATPEIRSLIEAREPDYAVCEAGFAKLRDHVQRVLRAAAHVLLSRDAPEGGNVVAIGAAEPRQTYVIIELDDDPGTPRTTLFTCDAENRCLKSPLPEARDGVVQMLLDEDSELLRALLDIKTEIFIR